MSVVGRRTRVIAMITAALVVATTSRTPAASAAAATPRRGGSITYGLEAETGGGWCPTTARLAVSGIEVGAAIYDTLVVPNSKGDIVPYLAESIEHDPDYVRWTIRLREGIRFHDGTALTAEVVRQNLDAYRSGPLIGSALEDVAGITVDSPTQLTITTSRPWVAFPWFLYLGGRLVIVAPAQLANPETCPRNLIGTGPFQFDHWTVNQELVVTRNPHYWQHDAQGRRLPYLDRITFRPVTEGVQRVNGLEAGQLDVIHTADGQQVDALVGHPKFNLVREQPGRGAVRYYLMNTAEPPLDDIRARRAIALAIDRHQINELRNGGIFEVADGPFDRSVAGYMKDPGYPHYSPKESARLVEAYKAEHDGGFHVVLAHTDDPADAAEAQLVKVQLGHVGIDATLQQLDQTAFILTAVAGNFSILLWRNHPGEDPDINYQWWSSDSLPELREDRRPEAAAAARSGTG